MVNLEIDLRPHYPSQTQAEYEPAARRSFEDHKVKGENVRLVVKIFEDEASKYDLEVIAEHLRAKGARSVEIMMQKYERS